MARSGRRYHGQWCWVRWAPLPSDHEVVPHIGYAIGRKVGNAVTRNRIRRRIRAVVSAESAELGPGLYLIGVRNAQLASMDFAQLRDDVVKILRAIPSEVDVKKVGG